MGPLKTSSSALLRCLLPVGLVLTLCGFTTTTLNPDKAEIVTSDVAHFWRAFDDAAKVPAEQRAQVYAREYFDVGSPGLKDFIPDRLVSPASFSQHVEKNRDYYAKIRPLIAQVVAQKAAITADFERLKAIYPAIRFPAHMYFLIGQQNSGGTDSDNGIIIGAETMAQAPDLVPFTVVHETIHFNQAVHSEGVDATLLQNTVIEGTADFVASLVVTPTSHINARRWQYGCAHEADIAARFIKDQDSTTMPPWMYSQPDNGWPSDMGYWLGYRIDQNVYAAAKDKVSAIRTLLQVRDFKAFLQASGYPGSKQPCTVEKPAA